MFYLLGICCIVSPAGNTFRLNSGALVVFPNYVDYMLGGGSRYIPEQKTRRHISQKQLGQHMRFGFGLTLASNREFLFCEIVQDPGSQRRSDWVTISAPRPYQNISHPVSLAIRRSRLTAQPFIYILAYPLIGAG